MVAMIFVLCFVISYGILAFLAMIAVVYEGYPTKLLAGLNAYFLLGDAGPAGAGAAGGSAPSKGSKGPFQAKGMKKDNGDWDDDLAKVIRYKITEQDIVGRQFFDDYNNGIMFFLMMLFCTLTRIAAEPFLVDPALRDALSRTDGFVVVICLVCVTRLISHLAHVQYDPTFNQSADMALGLVSGLLTAAFFAAILFSPASQGLDFKIQESAASFMQPVNGTGSQAQGPIGHEFLWWLGVSKIDDSSPKNATLVENTAANVTEAKAAEAPQEMSEETLQWTIAGVKAFGCFFAGLIGFAFMPAAIRVGRCYFVLSSPFPYAGSTLTYSPLMHGLCTLSLALPALATVLWISPMVGVFRGDGSVLESCTASGDARMCQAQWHIVSGDVMLEIFRHEVLFLANVVPLFLVRALEQAHMDSAYIYWYQQINGPASQVNEQNLTNRMNYAFFFFVKVAVQCVLPHLVGLSFLLLSWVCSVMELPRLPVVRLSSGLVRDIMLMCSWCCTSIWGTQTLAYIFFYRLGQVR